MADPRYDKINELFIEFSQGNFGYRIDLSDALDEIDAFISNINMLGEELQATTISLNYFNSIFDSVTDMIFVLDRNGNILNINRSVRLKTGLEPDELILTNITTLFSLEQFGLKTFDDLIELSKKQANFILTNSENEFPALCNLSKLYVEDKQHSAYIFVAVDITNVRELEETLKHSEEKYKKIFEDSSDAILMTNLEGEIIKINQAGIQMLGIVDESYNICDYFDRLYNRKIIKSYLADRENISNISCGLINKKNKNLVNVMVSAKLIASNHMYQFILKDVTSHVETENMIIRAITETQEKERQRFAKDIHDSLGQELSAIKFYLSAMLNNSKLDEVTKKLLLKSETGINDILTSIRDICFNLMPRAIEQFGLIVGVKELCKNIESGSQLKIKIKSPSKFPRMNFEIELAIFRIIQEFINNSLKHSKADEIQIIFQSKNKNIVVSLKDNGVGFNLKDEKKFRGMGLKNVISRAKAHGGNLEISSKVNQGTSYILTLPK